MALSIIFWSFVVIYAIVSISMTLCQPRAFVSVLFQKLPQKLEELFLLFDEHVMAIQPRAVRSDSGLWANVKRGYMRILQKSYVYVFSQGILSSLPLFYSSQHDITLKKKETP